ncbi:lipoprotein NlpD precursor [Shimwellia blattae DSM 4481 = NBRC 105725]|uniref:Murein hydrolase activator NlpD n=1 Tax=Shimwellia blattae (strain ATCC 29907 / DSM 4481 / JCM 1650 / NBRC 105725 / CDC 9005-74) TaxID=630626 RepID=I2B638_SHIBC|nr:lipoprotein NlpD precursor [Shimwellia blattae DSM 4481 = NBRC 105725]GAB81747.1 murein hydrolase activator NlpD [Shimwellia blattae DSM 4481 = NBRC 105725]VDY63468.1 Murein hydrolase activator NlpD precursor [Shimwellia blattae]VEC21391.1 Murein hydrolase activator NlpD precursor [Shimwellia blattae]
MSAGSPTFTLRRIAALSLVSLWLAGCSSNNTSQAPISKVGKTGSTSTSGGGMLSGGSASTATSSSGGMLITPPPKLPTTTTVQEPRIQPVQPVQRAEPVQTSRPVHTAPKATAPAQTQAQWHHDKVQVKDGRIVYNRKYGDIAKGSYNGGSRYTVQHGDTLFYIAWVTGNDYRDLAKRNNIPEPYSLTVGQTLKVGSNNNNVATASAPVETQVPVAEQKSSTTVASQPVITYSESSGEKSDNKMLQGNKTTVSTAPVASSVNTVSSSSSGNASVSAWRWPTEGKVIDNFSASEGGNKGIDIAGSKGQAIVATASGRVVYAGNALRGYGNLIIIKHNDDYLSAYAHNETMLVREQQEVKAGQKIATMGSTGTSSTRLHFEIRYKGKSVNPLQYLSQR